MTDQLHVAVIGLEFGAEFVPIYKDHPHVRAVTACDLDAGLTAKTAEQFQVSTADSLDDVLRDPDVDAVHIVTGLDRHAEHVIAALDAGKHTACTVPMALNFDEIERILDAQQRSGRNYMMMETAVFTREFFAARDLVQAGTLGEITYARGTHFQDMTDWPSYWAGLPPMLYSTHAISPILNLLNARTHSARGIGGGHVGEAERYQYGNPFSVEAALVTTDQDGLVVELARSLTRIARHYTESFSLYGDQAGFEWPQLENSEDPLLITMGAAEGGRGRQLDTRRLDTPDRDDLLPEPIRKFTRQFVYGEADDDAHLSFLQGGGHSGSHPHLVHEFVSSIVQYRPPLVDHFRAANWTGTGIAAHQSALAGGELVTLPTFARHRSPAPSTAARTPITH